MINQMNQNENTQNQFSNAIKELQIGKLMRKSNIIKSCGVSAYEVFQFLLLLVFQGRNLFRFLNSKRKEQVISKNTYYRFLNDTSFNWTKFLLLLAAKVTTSFSRLSLTRTCQGICPGWAGSKAVFGTYIILQLQRPLSIPKKQTYWPYP